MGDEIKFEFYCKPHKCSMLHKESCLKNQAKARYLETEPTHPDYRLCLECPEYVSPPPMKRNWGNKWARREGNYRFGG